MDCVFCKIVKGEIPATKVYEDDKVFAFLDIQPVSAGHALVVPKEHYESLSQTPKDILGEIFDVAVHKIAPAALAATGASGFNIGVNTGVAAGQVVMHAHVHVMPRTDGDGLAHWPKKQMSWEEISAVAEKMKAQLQQ